MRPVPDGGSPRIAWRGCAGWPAVVAVQRGAATTRAVWHAASYRVPESGGAARSVPATPVLRQPTGEPTASHSPSSQRSNCLRLGSRRSAVGIDAVGYPAVMETVLQWSPASAVRYNTRAGEGEVGETPLPAIGCGDRCVPGRGSVDACVQGARRQEAGGEKRVSASSSGDPWRLGSPSRTQVPPASAVP